MVLLHGASMSWRVWRPVLDQLESHHEVFAPTMCGHRGGTSWQEGVTVGVDALVDTVCAQLDGADIGSAHIVGNSLGGWVALELARRGRAVTCTALSPAGTFRSPRDLSRLRWSFRLGLAVARLPRLGDLVRSPRARHWLLRGAMEHGERLEPVEAVGLLEDLVGCTMITDMLATARFADAMPPLIDAPCPIRIAWSERDRTIPWARYGLPLRERVPTAEFVRLPGCGHMPMWDAPELVARTILQTTGAVRAGSSA